MNALQAEVALGVVVQLLVAVFVYGKLTQKVSGHADDIKELKAVDNKQWAKLDDHDKSFAEHGERLSVVETKLNIKKG